jgi:hypothetical protein
VAAACAAILLFGATGARAEDLPMCVQAEILKHQIAESIKNNRDEDALARLTQYHELEKRGQKIPPLVLFIEAQLSLRADDEWRAYSALKAFLQVARPSNIHYQDAIGRYTELSARPGVQMKVAAREAAQKQRQEEVNQVAQRARRKAAAEQAERIAEAKKRQEAEAHAQEVGAIVKQFTAVNDEVLHKYHDVCQAPVDREHRSRLDACFDSAMRCNQSPSCRSHSLEDHQACADAVNTWADKATSRCVRETVCPLLPQYYALADSVPKDVLNKTGLFNEAKCDP